MFNKVILVGRLARDPELKTFSNGGSVCKIRMITSSFWRDRETGDFREKAEGHNVAVYPEKLGQRMAEKCRKGDIILVEGVIETRRWTDNEGNTRYITEIAIRGMNGVVRRLPQGAAQTSALATEQGEAPASSEEGVKSSDVSSIDPEDIFDDWGGEDMSAFEDGDMPF
tara:strand:- start:1395 stop:1901 length:507 start_codon:yes stop_codon:yes gene_type:complete